MGVLRVARPDAGAGVRAAAGLSAADRATWALVALAALVLSVHLAQHVVGGIESPEWFFALGVVGAAGLWATTILWRRGSERARTLVLVPLGIGLVWGGLVMHAADAAADGLTATHATGILAGGLGLSLLALAAANLKRV